MVFMPFNNNNNNNWNLYSAFSIHKMFKSAAHCHSLSHSQQRLNGRAFHNLSALMEKARSPNLSLVRGSSRRPFASDRRWRLGL